MKKFLPLCTALMLAISAAMLGVSAYDYDPAYPAESFESSISDGIFLCDFLEIWEKTEADKNAVLKEGQTLRITTIGNSPDTMTDGRMVIVGGAEFTLSGEIFIERGAVLDIENGTLTIDGGTLTNCGTIRIGENGALKIKSGSLISTAAGNIENSGKLTCLSSDKSLESFFKKIKKYDGNFDLTDYSLSVSAKGRTAAVTANYCIGDIMTDYKYSFTVGGKSTKISRTNYSLDIVYDSKLTDKLSEETAWVDKCISDFKYFNARDQKNYGYKYSFKTKRLSCDMSFVVEYQISSEGENQ